MIEQKTIEIDQWTDVDEPVVFSFLPSGFPKMKILVTEDPHIGPECRLVNEEEEFRLIKQFRTL